MSQKRVITIAIAAVLSAGLPPARATAGKDNPGIVPIDGQGETAYGQLAAAWWKWAVETPTPQSPLLDTTGANCAVNQTQPGVWFLAGTLGGGTFTRSCAVPSATFLFFPLANTFYGAFLTDPPSTRTDGFVRRQTKCVLGAELHAEIDGVPVVSSQQYNEQSPLFAIHLPTDNVFGVTAEEVPELTLDPSVDRGYYLYLDPLSPGTHTIHFSTAPGTSTCTLTQDVTYTLTVGG
jgi:hypothetical protein